MGFIATLSRSSSRSPSNAVKVRMGTQGQVQITSKTHNMACGNWQDCAQSRGVCKGFKWCQKSARAEGGVVCLPLNGGAESAGQGFPNPQTRLP